MQKRKIPPDGPTPRRDGSKSFVQKIDKEAKKSNENKGLPTFKFL